MYLLCTADSDGRVQVCTAVACWDCGLETHQVHSLVIVVCCQVKVSATGRSLVQRSPTECSVSVGYREASIMRRLGAVAP